MLTLGAACQHVESGRSVSVLTRLVCRHNVLGDGDSVLWAASPVHHSPPAFHREVDVSMSCHWPLVNAQNWTQKGEHLKLSLSPFYTLWIFSLSNMCSSASLAGPKRSFWHSVTRVWKLLSWNSLILKTWDENNSPEHMHEEWMDEFNKSMILFVKMLFFHGRICVTIQIKKLMLPLGVFLRLASGLYPPNSL